MVVAGPGAEFDFGHELGPNVTHAARLVASSLPANGERLSSPSASQLGEQIFGHRAEKPVPTRPTCSSLAFLVSAQHQRADRVARSARRHIAADDELLPRRAFGLHPALAAARAIRRVAVLRDDAFEAEPAGVLQHERAVLLEMLAVADDSAGSRRRACASSGLALDQRHLRQIVAVEMQEIERVEHEAIGARLR